MHRTILKVYKGSKQMTVSMHKRILRVITD